MKSSQHCVSGEDANRKSVAMAESGADHAFSAARLEGGG